MASKKVGILLVLSLIMASMCINASVSTRSPSAKIPLLPDDLPTNGTELSGEEVVTLGVDDYEGTHPVYVLVFGDEEERATLKLYEVGLFDWDGYAKRQIERGDNHLVDSFGIDIRILGFEEWDSDDDCDQMSDLIDEFYDEESDHIGTYVSGRWWSGTVDVIFGITGQIVHDYAGCAYIDEDTVIVSWQYYWADNDIVKHEFGHIYGANDHAQGCCAMATGHEHFQTVIIEDWIWAVFSNIACCYTATYWCESCASIITSNRDKFSSGNGNGDGGSLGGFMDVNEIPKVKANPWVGIVLILTIAVGLVLTIWKVLPRLWRRFRSHSKQRNPV